MNLFKKVPFDHEGKQYEIRIMYNDTMINVGAFFNNYPANGFRHQIQIPKQCNIENLLKEYDLADLVNTAKNDLIQNNWEKVNKKIKNNMIST